MLEIFRILLYGRYKNKQKILNIHFRYETPHVIVSRLFLRKHFWTFTLKVLKNDQFHDPPNLEAI